MFCEAARTCAVAVDMISIYISMAIIAIMSTISEVFNLANQLMPP